ncbi:hypothetical protein FNW02_34705 [Komarekiella sp. 'clone 1']|uniref:Uncharacterized protein n=1 Tax=Komarekiella delphini-convector SJRDD-AB1 TaxID=2593771 RepID=A0AA40VV08_9NOST|nr:hypothetical protein [Komarekiella delphini-convector]MBD6620774.1 hypothetical protein [Komarekiella delphini-convector SJRDD-AB1]
MQPTITIPKDWDYPRYTFGQRTQQGIIVSLEYYTKDSFLAERYGSGWRYSVTPHKNSEELLHYHQEQIQPLSQAELSAQIITEIDAHQQ